jgi:hypothetical protein
MLPPEATRAAARGRAYATNPTQPSDDAPGPLDSAPVVLPFGTLPDEHASALAFLTLEFIKVRTRLSFYRYYRPPPYQSARNTDNNSLNLTQHVQVRVSRGFHRQEEGGSHRAAAVNARRRRYANADVE